MSNDDDDADRDLNDHNDKYDDDDDDDAEQVLIGGDDPVCKSCGIVRIEITDVQTTIALTATSKGAPKDFARMFSVRIAIFLVT